MYLLLDIGNTREKAALFNADSISALPQLNAENLKTLPLIAVYFACVANDTRLNALKVRLELDHLPWRQVVSEGQAFGVANCYTEPHLLGVDRWLAMLGAHKLFTGQSVMIVDAGTALTIDWLDERGAHQGGWIMPGLRLQQQSVVQQTAKVFNKELLDARVIPGRETISCLQNGCLAAVIGAIQQGWLLNKAERLVLTGGDALYLKPQLADLTVTTEPLLIFQGLARYIDH
ncbi:type III pantothenate kinase [Arsukibacterium tuosuense]|uniref:Type III pantothenate kinase n=1 Tax=Arsukibacterium tuosuense TaxID=1323745 RepID=A0A285JLC0_9GAMM|nr:type III pantothenate kinase [Arsukibacterium tuosuense]SNY61058.1 type III pantothenate kinase [Arsukibacterium tuosuense]